MGLKSSFLPYYQMSNIMDSIIQPPLKGWVFSPLYILARENRIVKMLVSTPLTPPWGGRHKNLKDPMPSSQDIKKRKYEPPGFPPTPFSNINTGPCRHPLVILTLGPVDTKQINAVC